MSTSLVTKRLHGLWFFEDDLVRVPLQPNGQIGPQYNPEYKNP